MDPFGETINKCIPIKWDMVELKECPFTYDYENNSADSSPSQSQPTPIFMLSLPDSYEHFETPPEHNNSSQPYFSGSDDPKLNGDTDDLAVDLANDSDELAQNVRVSDQKERLFSQTQQVHTEVLPMDFEDKLGDKVRVSDEPLGEKESRLVIEISQTQEVDTEVVPMDFEENVLVDDLAGKVCESGGGEADNVKFKDVVVDDGAASKEFDENDKLDDVTVQSQGVIEDVGGGAGRHGLPASMRGGARRNVGLTEQAGSSERVMTGSFKDLMEAVSKVIGNASSGDNSGDFFETAQRRGLNLRRPRWWPPEGFGN